MTMTILPTLLFAAGFTAVYLKARTLLRMVPDYGRKKPADGNDASGN